MRRYLTIACLLAAIVWPVRLGPAVAADSNSPGGPDLKTTLEKGLKARRPVEFAFIANVAARVEAGTLPRDLVNTSFLYAKRKRPYPFPYFQQSLKIRAQKAGISL